MNSPGWVFHVLTQIYAGCVFQPCRLEHLFRQESLEGHVLTFKCFGLEVRHELITWPQLTARWLENVQEHMGIQ